MSLNDKMYLYMQRERYGPCCLALAFSQHPTVADFLLHLLESEHLLRVRRGVEVLLCKLCRLLMLTSPVIIQCIRFV